MRILIATPLLPSQSGGPAQYAVGLKQSFESQGHQVEIVAFHDVLTYPSGIRHIIFFFKVYFKVKKVDAVIVLDTFSTALPAVVAARCAHKRVVVRTGGDFVWEQYIERTKKKIPLSVFYESKPALSKKERIAVWLQRNVVIPFAHVFVFSTQWQQNIWNVPYGLRGRNIAVIQNTYLPDVRGHVASPHNGQVVWIGRDIILKNVDTLDKAIEIVKKEIPTLEYKKYTSVPHTEVLNILAQSRLLVIPSLSEVSPNLALEALALGVPVLMTRDCGIVDILGDAVTWIDSLSIDNIAHTIIAVMTEEGYKNARSKAIAFTNTRTYAEVARDFLAILESADIPR